MAPRPENNVDSCRLLVEPLTSLCMTVVLRHLDRLDDVGDIHECYVAQIFNLCNTEQLRRIEDSTQVCQKLKYM